MQKKKKKKTAMKLGVFLSSDFGVKYDPGMFKFSQSCLDLPCSPHILLGNFTWKMASNHWQYLMIF